jgi:two-component sensor histidine kinase
VEVLGVRLSLDQALPCGLILNELVTNSLKHAFVSGTPASKIVKVRAELSGEDVILEVSDNGPGFPEQQREGSLGLRLVRTLTRQLGGQVTFSSTDGAKVTIVFRADVIRSEP